MRRKIRRISIKFRRMTQILCDEYNVFVASDETQDTKIFRLLSQIFVAYIILMRRFSYLSLQYCDEIYKFVSSDCT